MADNDTLVHRIAGWARQAPDRNALHVKRNGAWESLSWGQYWGAIQEVARGLLALGHKPGECIAIVGANRPEWVQLQFGAQAICGVPAPIYATSTVEQVGYILSNSQARIAVCDTGEQLNKYLQAEAAGHCERFEHLVVFDPPDSGDERVLGFDELRRMGREQSGDAFDTRFAELKADQTCLLIYTSGTTGQPKGVMLDHAGQLEAVKGVLEVYGQFKAEVPYRVVSYLPLSHQTEQLVTNVGAIVTGGEVYFCPDLNQIKDYLAVAHPTLFLGVPRVWEKFEAALRANLGQATGIKARLAAWAMKTELEGFKRSVERGQPYLPLKRVLAQRLVIDKVKAALGLDQLSVGMTGAAPIGVATQEFFASLGICINEGYGMSETSGVATVTDRRRPRFGTVGKAVRGVDIRITEEGEIQLKGRSMTKGYFRLPEASAELYTEDGWLRTGDLGEQDAEGNLRITGRTKELLITAGGKNVAPVEMENYIKAIEGVGQAVAVGDGQPYICALITLDPENLEALAQQASVAAGSMEQMAQDAALERWLMAEIDKRCNTNVARYQTIKKIKILPVEFSVEGGELTPTMKLRRNIIAKKYASDIQAFYADKNQKAIAEAS